MTGRRGAYRKKSKWGGPLPLSITLIALSLIIWFAHFASMIAYADCAHVAFWVGGWFSFTSLFQWTGVAIAAATLLWAASFLNPASRKAWGEALAQGALLFTLGFWLLAVKSYVFPFATPSEAQMNAIVGAAFPMDAVLEAEPYPPRPVDPDKPKVEFEDFPLFDPSINKRPGEIFTSRFSPTAADMKRLDACVAEQRRAIAQWKIDRETLRKYYDKFDYRQKPKRPLDWREEIAEEDARGEGAAD